MKLKLALLLGAAAIWQPAAYAQAIGTAQTGEREAAGSGTSEIVVTAQRREERLTDVPVSISVLSNDALEAGSVSTVNDALRNVPGVSAFENGQGGLSKFSIRGVTSNNSLFNGSSVVGYYLDEIPFAFVRYPVSPDAGAFDIDRVEVLRGPQGTLYGANALNGVVRVMTADADLDDFGLKWRGTLSSTRAGGENFRTDAAVNVPIVPGRLAVRLVGSYSDYDGWIDQVPTGARNVNDTKQKSLRVKVNALPADNFNVELMGWISRTDRGGNNEGAPGNRFNTASFPEPVKTDFDAFNLTLTYDLPSFSITSATSHIKFNSSSVQDVSGDRLLTGLGARMTSQEVRLVSTTGGDWAWSLGGIYRDARDTQFSDFTLDNLPAFLGVSDNVYTSESFAIYGELTRRFFDGRLELTGGLRYFEDKQASDELATISTGAVPFGRREDKFKATTPRVVIAFHPDKRSTIYASYSQGFRSGFAQNGEVLRLSNGLATAIKPDRLNNYEVGAKGVLFDGAVSFDVAAYYIDWEETVQVVQTIFGEAGNTFAFNGAVNAPGARGFGTDISLTVRPTRGLSIGGSFSWNDLTFAEDVISGTTVVFPKGTRLVESPKYTASGSIDYRHRLSESLSAAFSASVSYTSSMLTGTIQSRLEADDMTLVRSSIALESDRNWSVTLFADNLLDESGFTRLQGLRRGFLNGDFVRPRTFGIQLDFKY